MTTQKVHYAASACWSEGPFDVRATVYYAGEGADAWPELVTIGVTDRVLVSPFGSFATIWETCKADGTHVDGYRLGKYHAHAWQSLALEHLRAVA